MCPTSKPPTTNVINIRVSVLEDSLGQMKLTLEELVRSDSLVHGLHENARRSKAIVSSKSREFKVKKGNRVQNPLVADRNSRTAPASLIRDMKHYILGGEKRSHESESFDDVVAKGIITEEMALSLLIG